MKHAPLLALLRRGVVVGMTMGVDGYEKVKRGVI